MGRPVIGLNMSLAPLADDDRWEARAPLAYAEAVAGAGGIPLFLPPLEGPLPFHRFRDILEGVLLIGGADYRPHHYGGHPQPEEELVPERRDRFDLALAGWVLEETDLPVLGICGGCQLLALARGGGLVQDIGTEWSLSEGALPLPHAGGQRSPEERHTFRHDVTLIPGSLVAEAIRIGVQEILSTNSYHHQAVLPDRPGQGFRISARSGDGIVEAIEPVPTSPWGRAGRFVLGVQWHPERMLDEAPQRHLFSALVEAARQGKRS
jgi:putative glutamine amidotransferase